VGAFTAPSNASRVKNSNAFIASVLTALLLAACNGGDITPSAPGAASQMAASRAAAAAKAGYKQLYRFKGTPDGASPYSGFAAIGGTLYATTLNGSPNYCSTSCGGNYCYLGCGTVFSVTSAGDYNVVYNFKGNFGNAGDGSWPFAGPLALDGTLYGTAAGAGAHAMGAVYSVTPGGTESVLYSFAGGNDGSVPEAGLTAMNGKLYGATLQGGGTGCGGSGCGAVFEVTTSGHEHVLYGFAGGTDGAKLYSGVTALKGKLYGASLFGGGSGCGGNGCGTIYQVTTKGKEHVLYRFQNSGDGAYPNGLIAVKGVLYGTTEGGGNKNSGTFFSITPSGSFHTLYNFQDIPDGNLPGANLIYDKGKFYGTTVGGGTGAGCNYCGTVYSITKTGVEKVLYSFQGGNDGNDPQGPLYATGGKLYGTTTTGGGTGCSAGTGCGTVFRIKE
jgi:uncharacterized repeat protein (TIGR03803 family)